MKVCDRHHRTKAVVSITISSTDSQFDLCKDCANQIESFLANSRKDTVEQKGVIQGLKEKFA